MLKMNEQEINEIDEQLDSKLQWAENNKELAEQLAMDSTRLMSCTAERLSDYKDKGFFKRCVASFSGKTAKMQRDNQNDIIQMQKVAWRYLQMLNERDVLMSHSLITIKNNLETLAIKETETRDEIARFAIKVKNKFNSLSERIDELEVAMDIQQWLSTIEIQEYDERYPKHMRLLCLVRDFRLKKANDWNMKNIQCLVQAIHSAKINRKEEVTIEEFISNLIEEIEEHSFEKFNKITTLSISDSHKIDTSFLVEEISSPTFNSLYQISNKYIYSDDTMEALKDDLTIERKEAIKKIILWFIKKSGVDINKKIQMQDIAFEILSCSKLAQELFEKNYLADNKEVINKVELQNLEQINVESSEENTNNLLENIEIINNQPDLELPLMPNKISSGDDFNIIISSDGKVKTFGSNSNYCLGVGSNEYFTKNVPIEVLDVPKNAKCISVNAGTRHCLALFENNELYAWGNSSYGQLGDNTKDDRLSAFKVIGLPKDIKIVKILGTNFSSIVLLETGDLYATGDLTNSLIFKPYKLNFKVKDFEMLYSNYADTALVLLDKDSNIFIKKLSYGDSLSWCNHEEDDFFQPKGLHEDAVITKLSAGYDYLHVLTQKNILYGIGSNISAQIGNNERTPRAVESFTKIYSLEGTIKQLSTNHNESNGSYDKNFVVVLTDKKIYGWGTNENCQLGKQKNYRSEYSTTGLIKKTTHETKYYLEKKPKIIENLLKNIDVNHNLEISCGNESTFIYDITNSRIYETHRWDKFKEIVLV